MAVAYDPAAPRPVDEIVDVLIVGSGHRLVDIGADGAIARLIIYRLTPISSPLAP